MTTRKALVLINGQVKELPNGDSLVGAGASGVDSINGLQGVVTLKTVNGNALTGTGDITITGGTGSSTLDGLSDVVITTPATDQVLRHNGSDWVNVTGQWDSTNNVFTVPYGTSFPTPTTGNVNLYSFKIAGKPFVGFKDDSGIESVLQSSFAFKKQSFVIIAGGGTISTSISGLVNGTHGTATARNLASTNIRTRARRIAYVSAATTGSLSAYYITLLCASLGNGTGLGGFLFSTRFGTSDATTVSGARAFIGLSTNISTQTNVEPSSITNCFGIAQLSTDNSQWYFVYGGSSAKTPIALGHELGAPTLTDTIFELTLYSNPQKTGHLAYRVKNLASGASASGELTNQLSSELPAADIYLSPRLWRCNNTTAAAVALDLITFYIESDY